MNTTPGETNDATTNSDAAGTVSEDAAPQFAVSRPAPPGAVLIPPEFLAALWGELRAEYAIAAAAVTPSDEGEEFARTLVARQVARFRGMAHAYGKLLGLRIIAVYEALAADQAEPPVHVMLTVPHVRTRS